MYARVRPRTLPPLALAALALAAAVAGCAGAPSPLDGTVRFRDSVSAAGKGGSVIAVTTDDVRKAKSAATPITREEMGALVADLDEIGLFALQGRAEAPAVLAPGSIAVAAGDRRFSVTLRDLTSTEEGRAFTSSVARIIKATQGGAHFTLTK